MSDSQKRTVDRWLAIIGIFAGIGGGFYSLFLLPYRMDAQEKQIEVIRRDIDTRASKRDSQFEALSYQFSDIKDKVSRIDERTKIILERTGSQR